MLKLQETGQSLYTWENLKEFLKSHKSWTGAFYQPLIYHGLLMTLTVEVIIHMYWKFGRHRPVFHDKGSPWHIGFNWKWLCLVVTCSYGRIRSTIQTHSLIARHCTRLRDEVFRTSPHREEEKRLNKEWKKNRKIITLECDRCHGGQAWVLCGHQGRK